MKVLALTEGPNHVCYRYRIEAFAMALAQRGWTLESLPLALPDFPTQHAIAGRSLSGRRNSSAPFAPFVAVTHAAQSCQKYSFTISTTPSSIGTATIAKAR